MKGLLNLFRSEKEWRKGRAAGVIIIGFLTYTYFAGPDKQYEPLVRLYYNTLYTITPCPMGATKYETEEFSFYHYGNEVRYSTDATQGYVSVAKVSKPEFKNDWNPYFHNHIDIIRLTLEYINFVKSHLKTADILKEIDKQRMAGKSDIELLPVLLDGIKGSNIKNVHFLNHNGHEAVKYTNYIFAGFGTSGDCLAFQAKNGNIYTISSPMLGIVANSDLKTLALLYTLTHGKCAFTFSGDGRTFRDCAFFPISDKRTVCRTNKLLDTFKIKGE